MVRKKKKVPDSMRTYDDDGLRKRASCICFKSLKEEEILLVSSTKYPDNWIIPGGGVEPGEEPANTAKREVLEEAGVLGDVVRFVGEFENTDRKHRTRVFVLMVKEELESWEDAKTIGRKRKWFSIGEAISELHKIKSFQAHYLEKAKDITNR